MSTLVAACHHFDILRAMPLSDIVSDRGGYRSRKRPKSLRRALSVEERVAQLTAVLVVLLVAPSVGREGNLEESRESLDPNHDPASYPTSEACLRSGTDTSY